MKGRKPKPTAQKIFEGNPGKKKLPENEPTPSGWETLNAKGLPPYPKHLSPSSRKVWDEIVPEMMKMGIFTPADSFAMEALCNEISDYRRIRKRIHKEGDLVKCANGTQRKNPLHSIAKEKLSTIDKYGAKFGFSPADRERIKSGGKSEGDEDELAKFIDEGKRA